MSTPITPTPEELELVNAYHEAQRKLYLEGILADFDAIKDKIENPPGASFPGGMNYAVMSAKNMIEVQKAEIARSYGLSVAVPVVPST